MKLSRVLLELATFFKRTSRPVALLFLAVLLLSLAACSPGAGILSGGNWQASGLQNQQLQALAADPKNLQHIYAGDARDGIFISTDAGVSWEQSNAGLSLPLDVHALAFNPAGKKLYAATSTGLFVSTDSAASWSSVKGAPADIYTVLAFDLNSPLTIYAGTASAGVLKSTDDGTTWTPISLGLPTGSAPTGLLYDSYLKQLWATFANVLYRSDNGGASWQVMDTGLPANVGINTISQGTLATGGSGPVFLGTEHGFFLSSDDGQHWAQSQSSLADLHITAVLPDATQPAIVYISTNIGVLHSQDNGQTWQSLAQGLPAAQTSGSLLQASDSYAQLLVVAHGIYRYPGTGSVFDFSRLLPIALIVLFFVFLYRFQIVRRRAARQRRTVRNEQTLPVDNTRDEPSQP
jgi:photosystem II stability/assembly factor-like uncharacterized protein